MSTEHNQRVVLNPKIMVGKPVIKGTRIPAALIVRLVAQGVSHEDILREYPRLQEADITAALTYAAEVLASEAVFPLSLTP